MHFLHILNESGQISIANPCYKYLLQVGRLALHQRDFFDIEPGRGRCPVELKAPYLSHRSKDCHLYL
jgi:hypothetical protein